MTATSVVCLKGMRDRYGPRLELPAAAGLVYVGRACSQGGWKLRCSPWANPFSVQKCGGAQKAVDEYAGYLLKRPDLIARLPELRGRRLGCWCAEGMPCHALLLARWVDHGVPRARAAQASFDLQTTGD